MLFYINTFLDKQNLRKLTSLALFLTKLSEDMLHPNELGFSLYAENLIAQMIKVK